LATIVLVNQPTIEDDRINHINDKKGGREHSVPPT